LSLVAGILLGVLTNARRFRRGESETDKSVREFYKTIRRGKSVVMFTAAWCGPCKIAGPMMTSIQESGEYPRMDFMKVDIGSEEGKVICSQYGVRGLPTFMFFNEGEPYGDATMGARATTNLGEKVRELDAAMSPSLMLASLD
jgi:thioredoxin 1